MKADEYVLDDSELSNSVFSKCMSCIHYLKNHSCKAFKKIPMEIWNGDIDHTKPYKNDNGIRYQKR